MKGISEIVAMLLMLVITIGLVGTVWYFISTTTSTGTILGPGFSCLPNGRVVIVGTYSGADADNTKFSVRYRQIGGGAAYTSATPLSVFKGISCNPDNVGIGDCNQVVSATNPVKNQESIGLNFTISGAPGKSYEVVVFAWGREAGRGSVSCP